MIDAHAPSHRLTEAPSSNVTPAPNLPAFHRILLIHFGQMGDAVLAQPAARALREHFVGADITVLASPAAVEIFRLGGFERTWKVDRVRWKHHRLRAVFEIPRLVMQLRRARFDLSVDLHSLKETSLLAWAAGIPTRVAMLRPTRSYPCLITLKPPPDDADGVLLDRYCRVLEPLGIKVRDRVPRLRVPEATAAEVEQLFARHSLVGHELLGICPGAGHSSRRWPADRFARVATELFAQYGPFKTVVFLGPEEDERALEPLRGVPEITMLRGLSIPQLAQALARCRLVLTNATGPSHIAAVMGTRVITIGEIPPFDPVASDPAKVFCVRVSGRVADIPVEDVLPTAQRMWR